MRVGLMILAPLALLAQTAVPQAVQQPGSIQGSVVGSDTNAGLAHAAILLRPVRRDLSAGAIIRGNTDEKGEFALTNVAPGAYMLTVERAGYGRVNYTEGTAAFRAPRFVLKAGEAKTVRLRMTPLGTVTGSVVGPDGAPLAHARAILSHYIWVEGTRVLAPEREVAADSSGAFQVTGVPAGQYLLSAYSRGEVVYAPSYYPGSASPSGAQPLKVEMGRTVGGLKLQLATATAFAILGHVTDTTGTPVAGATVLARRQPEDGVANLLGSESLTGKTGAAGEFMLPRLLPGKYRLEVSGTTQKLTGSSTVDLGSQDLRGVALVAGPGAVVTGHMVIEGNITGLKGPVSPRLARISLRPDAGGMAHTAGVIAADATFRIENVPEGAMRFVAGMNGDGYFLKSIVQNGRDLTDQALDVRTSDQIDSVEVVISLNAAQLSGKVVLQAGAPQPEVIVFPTQMQTPRARQRLTKVAHVNESGQFTIRGIAPGEYGVIAVRGATEGSEGDANFQSAIEPQAKRVVLAAGRASAGILQAIDAPQ